MLDESSLEVNRLSLCQIDELNLSCFGCCGHGYIGKDEVFSAIDKNTEESEEFIDSEEKVIELQEFAERHPKKILRLAGVCYNLIWEDKECCRTFCPLHPRAVKNFKENGFNVMMEDCDDLRVQHCKPEHECTALKKFKAWNIEKKKQYIDFLRNKIKKKELDWYSYSVNTDNNKLLEEFEASLN